MWLIMINHLTALVFNRFLKMVKDSAAGIELGKSFHQEGTFNVNVCESDYNVIQ